jgi:hypothetical protein
MAQRGHLAVADHHLSRSIEDRLHHGRDVAGVVLVVGIGVDDDVRAPLDGIAQTGGKGDREPTVDRHPDHFCACPARHLRGSIGRSVIDYQDLDLINAVNCGR